MTGKDRAWVILKKTYKGKLLSTDSLGRRSGQFCLLTFEINAILFETRIGPSSAREYTATASASLVRLATVLMAPAASHAV